MKVRSGLKEFIRYCSLSVLGMVGLSCYILADTFFISKALGVNGLTALNLAIPVYSLIHGCGLMVGMGGGIKYSVFKSQGNQKEANRIFTGCAVLAALFAGGFVLAGIFGPEWIAQSLGADSTVFPMTKTYLQVILLFAPCFLANNLLLCFTRNDGQPQLSMAAMIGGSLSNIVLDYVFMFPFQMGIFGAVLATGLAPVISVLILSPYFLKKKNQFHFRKGRIPGSLSCGILFGGLPFLITELASGIIIIVFNRIILGLAGNVGVAAYSIVANLSLVVMSVYTGISQGMQPILSTNYGTGNQTEIRRILGYGMVSVGVLSVLIYLGIFFGAEPIAGIFNGGRDEQLQRIAVSGLRLYFPACIFAGFNIVMSVYFTATGRPVPSHIISLLRGFIVMIPMAFVMSAAFGLYGAWLAFPAAELIVCIVGAALFGIFRLSKKGDL